jgi:hypothetical protein
MTAHIRVDKDLEEDPRVWRLGDQVLDQIVQLIVGLLPGEATRSHEILEELRRALRDPSLVDQLRPETRNALHALRGVTCNAALGALVKLWRYADRYISADDALPTALHELPEVVDLPIAVLRKFPPEWLMEMPDGRVRLPDYTAKNALNTKEKRRSQSRERVRRWRERKAREESGGVGVLQGRRGNALHGVTSNARNAPSRVGARTGIPETETVPLEENPLSPLGRGNSERRDRAVRDRSAKAWDQVLVAVQRGESTLGDAIVDQAVRSIGGYHALGQAHVSQRAENRRRFREQLERLLEEHDERGAA